MRRVFRLTAVMLLSAALSLAAVVRAHLHLCFHGLELPTAVHHLAEHGDHAEHHAPEREHSDSDVELGSDLTQALKRGVEAPALSTGAPDASAPAVRGFRSRPTLYSRARSEPRFRLPQLRAPPA